MYIYFCPIIIQEELVIDILAPFEGAHKSSSLGIHINRREYSS